MEPRISDEWLDKMIEKWRVQLHDRIQTGSVDLGYHDDKDTYLALKDLRDLRKETVRELRERFGYDDLGEGIR